MESLSIEEEEEEPFVFPDLPQFQAQENNALSIVGRLLNPRGQKMSSFILDMPRKWGVYSKVRGVALSQERFQFFFKHEDDLLSVLANGTSTYNEWSFVMDRWVDPVPEDFLQFTPVWVQIQNFPMKFSMEETIKAFAGIVGIYKGTDFDSTKPQTRTYMRAKVLFDVSKPLKRWRTVTLPGGEKADLGFYFEDFQKRCYECQRLTHDNLHCPYQKNIVVQGKDRVLRILESDPLFGVLTEEQVGEDATKGVPKIHPEILHEMRQYLSIADAT